MLIDRLLESLSTVTSRSALPYGYTLTVWSSGAVLMHYHSTPAVGDVFMFLGGAILGFIAVSLLSSLRSSSMNPSGVGQKLAGGVHLAAVGGAVGAATLVAMIASWPAWPLGSFTATVIYLLLAAAELLFAERTIKHRPFGD